MDAPLDLNDLLKTILGQTSPKPECCFTNCSRSDLHEFSLAVGEDLDLPVVLCSEHLALVTYRFLPSWVTSDEGPAQAVPDPAKD